MYPGKFYLDFAVYELFLVYFLSSYFWKQSRRFEGHRDNKIQSQAIKKM